MFEAIFLFGSYLLASIPFGLVVGKMWSSIDVRTVGSGNIGTSNVMRSVGRTAAALVLILDVLKGFVPVWLALNLGFSAVMVAAVAVAVVLGHIGSVFLRFNGGKGVATAFGAALALDGGAALSLVIVWGAVLFFSRYISLASLIGAVWLPISLWLATDSIFYVLAGIAIALMAIWRHRDNWKRLRSGNEYRLGERAQKAEKR